MDPALIMSPSRNMKISWSKFRSSLFTSKNVKSMKDGEEKKGLSRKLTVNEEYKQVFRTQSYAEIWSKVQLQLKKSSSSYVNLIEPRQEAAMDMINSSDLRLLLKDYLESSLEAYKVCELLLRGIHKTRSNHRLVKRAIKGGGDVINDLACFAALTNPLSVNLKDKVDFHNIHDKHALLLRSLISRRRKIKRREKLKKAAGYSFVITYVVLAVAVLALAMHSVVGLLGAPGLLIASSSTVIKKAKQGKGGLKLQNLASQLDVAAKAVYILINDFDTMGRLVMRVHDEVDHIRALANMCVRNTKNQELVKEGLRELSVYEDALVHHLEELEDHIYLCFLTINRSRRLLIQQILSS